MTELEIRQGLRRNDELVVMVEQDYMYQVGLGDDAVPTVGTLFFADQGFVEGDPFIDTYFAAVPYGIGGADVDGVVDPLTEFEDVLQQVPIFERSLDRKTLRGKYAASVSDYVINNADGRHDFVLALALDGSETRVYVRRRDWTERVLLFTAIALKAESQDKKLIRVAMRDASLFMNKQIGGEVVVGGTGPSAEKFRAFNFGRPHQVKPTAIDTLNYAHSDRGASSSSAPGTTTIAVAVRSNGVDMAEGVDWVDNGDGTFTLAVPPTGNEDITCDVLAHAATPTDYRLSDAMDEIVGVRAGLNALGRYGGRHATYFDSFESVTPLNDYHIGLSVAEKRGLIELLDELMSTANGFWSIDRNGVFYFGRMRPECIATIIAYSGGRLGISCTITKDDIPIGAGPTLTHNTPSFVSYQSYANKNWYKQSTFSSSLDADERTQYEREGVLSAHFVGEEPGTQQYLGAVFSYQGGAPELYHKTLTDSQVVSTLIAGPDDTSAPDPGALPTAWTLPQYQAAWASIRRSQALPWTEFLDFTVGLDFYDQVELGDVVNLIYPRFDLDAGELHQVCTIRVNPRKGIDLGVVRRRFAGVSGPLGSFELREDGGRELREDDGGELRP